MHREKMPDGLDIFRMTVATVTLAFTVALAVVEPRVPVPQKCQRFLRGRKKIKIDLAWTYDTVMGFASVRDPS